MKKLIGILFVAVLAACGGGNAVAAEAVKSTASPSVITGEAIIVSVEKDTSSGNRALIRKTNGAQAYVNDDGMWTRYTEIVSSMGGNAVAATSAGRPGLVYNLSKVEVSCSGSTSVVSFAAPVSNEMLSDGCAFWSAAYTAAK
jgi:hypothetical protein